MDPVITAPPTRVIVAVILSALLLPPVGVRGQSSGPPETAGEAIVMAEYGPGEYSKNGGKKRLEIALDLISKSEKSRLYVIDEDLVSRLGGAGDAVARSTRVEVLLGHEGKSMRFTRVLDADDQDDESEPVIRGGIGIVTPNGMMARRLHDGNVITKAAPGALKSYAKFIDYRLAPYISGFEFSQAGVGLTESFLNKLQGSECVHTVMMADESIVHSYVNAGGTLLRTLQFEPVTQRVISSELRLTPKGWTAETLADVTSMLEQRPYSVTKSSWSEDKTSPIPIQIECEYRSRPGSFVTVHVFCREIPLAAKHQERFDRAFDSTSLQSIYAFGELHEQ